MTAPDVMVGIGRPPTTRNRDRVRRFVRRGLTSMRYFPQWLAARVASGYWAVVRPSVRIPVCSYEVVRSYRHDPEAYTQGLVFHNGRLFEGTGLLGRSSVREVDLDSGQVVRQLQIDDKLFGEGIAIVETRLFQLTWRSHNGFIYDLRTFAPVGEFTYEGEGWGLTYDGRHLVMSDGSARLRFIDPDSFVVVRRLKVHAGGRPVARLNELQYVDGEIFANVYQTDRIARIDPETGELVAWIDLADLLAREDRTPSADVLNGIGYDAETGRLVVTGKFWPRLYEIRLVSATGQSACPTVGRSKASGAASMDRGRSRLDPVQYRRAVHKRLNSMDERPRSFEGRSDGHGRSDSR